jgi:hypothetical protein
MAVRVAGRRTVNRFVLDEFISVFEPQAARIANARRVIGS